MDLNQMRTLVRRDLHDEDAANYRWSNNEIDRHIQRAVTELSLAVPQEIKATLTTTAGSRNISVSTLTNLINIEAVEYPVDKHPPVYVRFSLWAQTLALLIEKAPAGSESVYVYYGKLHTLDATTSTIPSRLEDLIATGAAAYAALEWSSFATNRVNVGGESTWRYYQAWGQERLSAFLKGLANNSVRNALHVKELYLPAQPKPSQTTDWGP